MNSAAPNQESRLLNLGCGRHFHADWLNVDLVACDPHVMQADLTRGVPFPEGRFDAVYHSHVLEHLDQEAGRSFLRECHRVLSPGGVLRVAVPDVEQIARQYLVALEEAVAGTPESGDRHAWMKLELLDQLVRTESGGRMGVAMRDANDRQRAFISQRMGGEMFGAKPAATVAPRRESWWRRRQRRFARLRDRLVNSLIKRLYGDAAVSAWEEARFRGRGEIHRWMYDRFDLAALLTELGFVDVRVVGAQESAIENFASFGLDAQDGQTRKPDSLFIEARKPAAALQQRTDRRQAA